MLNDSRFSILLLLFCLFLNFGFGNEPLVKLGIERLFNEKKNHRFLKGKRIGLITNHTSVSSQNETSIELFKKNQTALDFKLVALFAPEHGLNGNQYAEEYVPFQKDSDGIPIFSLHGATRRPTSDMLNKIDLLVYDIQDIGSRSYTYISTLFYVMEEAAKKKIPVLVTDRPNPINGKVVDGPMLEEKLRSFVGYINVPYCHGMTICELAHFFNEEYHVGCDLLTLSMKGWKRSMTFQDTKLTWIPTSPQIPTAETVLYYPTTGILGELQLVNIGVGYTLPFKIVGAPWIKAKSFAKHLNEQKFPGVSFHPFYFKPFFGRFAHENCEGVLIVITDPLEYQPVSTQYLIIGVLKSLYPLKFEEALAASANRKLMFAKVNGTEKIYDIISKEKYIVWKLKDIHREEKIAFLRLREKYLIKEYSSG